MKIPFLKPKEPRPLSEDELASLARKAAEMKELSLEDVDMSPLWQEPQDTSFLLYLLIGAGIFLNFVTLIIVIFKK